MEGKLIVVATFNRRHEADFARGYLEDAGIPAVLGADDAGGADLGLAFSRQVRLLVREEDLRRARAVLRDAGVLEEDDGEAERLSGPAGGDMPAERSPARLLRAALWRRLDLPALEHFRLWREADAFRLEGRAFLALEGKPLEAAYEVVCSGSWATRTARVRVERGAEIRTVELRRDDGDRWSADGERFEELDGIADVDLGFTPSTNTLPIRRLSLEVGSASDLRAAWVRFPELSVEVLDQRYVRTAPAGYRYESRGGSFAADLTVDGLGVVVTYGDLWERVAVA